MNCICEWLIKKEKTSIIKDRVEGDEAEGWKPGKCIEFSVSDTGIGIRKEYQQLIFDRFEQADGTSSSMCKGAGLGLSMVYGIVKQNSGFIYIDGEKGKGTTIRILLPRHHGETVSTHE